jgi:hypothetical protein
LCKSLCILYEHTLGALRVFADLTKRTEASTISLNSQLYTNSPSSPVACNLATKGPTSQVFRVAAVPFTLSAVATSESGGGGGGEISVTTAESFIAILFFTVNGGGAGLLFPVPVCVVFGGVFVWVISALTLTESSLLLTP